MRERDPFIRLAGTGLACIFGVQAIINMGVAVRLLPAKGMTLPFVSYGGSSLIAGGIAVGMLLAFTRTRPQGRMGDILLRARVTDDSTPSDNCCWRHWWAYVSGPSLGRGDVAKGWRVKLSTDARGARYTSGFPSRLRLNSCRRATFARGGFWAKLMVPFVSRRHWRANMADAA